MHSFTKIIPLLLILSFLCINAWAAKDSTRNTDSTKEASAKKSGGDNPSEDLLDSIYVPESEAELLDVSSSDTIEETVVSPEHRKDVIAISQPVPLKLDIEKKQSSQKETLGYLKKQVIAFVLKILYFGKHALFLLFSIGVILYTYLFVRKKVEDKRFLTSTRLSVMDKEVQIACKYMEKNYWDSDLTIEQICEELVTGVAFLEALFDRELGMSIEEFLTHVRINRAKKYVEKVPEITIDELYSKIGYDDEKTFVKDFRRIIGLTFEEFQSSFYKTSDS